MTGIYQIRNLVNERRYIGSAIKLGLRRHNHFGYLRRGVSHCLPLQHAWNKYGSHSFVFEIIEHCSPEQLLIREQFHIDRIGLRELYNTCHTAGNQFGLEHSVDSRRKMAQAAKARWNGASKEMRKKQTAEANAHYRGHKQTVEDRAAKSVAAKAYWAKITPEERERRAAISRANGRKSGRPK